MSILGFGSNSSGSRVWNHLVSSISFKFSRKIAAPSKKDDVEETETQLVGQVGTKALHQTAASSELPLDSIIITVRAPTNVRGLSSESGLLDQSVDVEASLFQASLYPGRKKQRLESPRAGLRAGAATLPKLKETKHPKYETKTPATTDFHPINQTTKILTSRSVVNPQGPPQSYTWKTFWQNQVKFMTTWSLGEVLGVLNAAFGRGLSSVNPVEQLSLCSNKSTLTSCRFLPTELEATDTQTEEAKKSNNWIDATWKGTVVGHFVEQARTHCGKQFILVRAANPVSDKEMLKCRVIAVRELLSDEEFRKNVQRIVDSYGANESSFLNQFDPKGPGTKKPGRLEVILKPPMFETFIPDEMAAKFRQSPFLITVNDTYKTGYDMFMTALKVSVAAMAMFHTATRTFGLSDEPVDPFEQGLVAGTAGGAMIVSEWAANSQLNSVLARNMIFVVGESVSLNMLGIGLNSGGYAFADHMVKLTMQNVMVKVVACIRAMDDMYNLLKDTDFSENLEHFDRLRNLMESEEPEIKQLLELIRYKTFDSESSTGLFRAGPMFVLWDLIQNNTKTVQDKKDEEVKRLKPKIEEMKKTIRAAGIELENIEKKHTGAWADKKHEKQLKVAELRKTIETATRDKDKVEAELRVLNEQVPEVKRLILDAMIAMGEIDGNLTLAEKVLNSTLDAPYSILDIPREGTAAFSINRGHFPPVSPEALVEQSKVESGDIVPMMPLSSIDLPPISIITAENGAGKSTFALNWINNILARQSLGVVPCGESSEFPIYDRVISSLGVTHTNLKSSFEMTDEFVKQVLVELKGNPEMKFFLVFDELYRDTDPEKSTTRLTAFATKLRELHDENPNFTAVFITHSDQFAKSQQGKTKVGHYTTTKTAAGRPSGILEPGLYKFSAE